jgi:raffinose/stachyose/melibiose transport system substrate-binding protein
MAKKIFVLFLSLAMVGMFIGGCATSAPPAATVAPTQAPATAAPATVAPTEAPAAKLTGNLLWCSHRTDFQTTLLPQYAAEFNKLYPDVKISIETYKDYRETVRIKMSSNDMPDVLGFAFGDYTADQITTNFLPLDNIDYASKFDANVNKQFTASTNGKLYGLSTGVSAAMVIYNKKIFAELKLTVPETLDDFITVCKAITASGKVALGSSAKAKWPLDNYCSGLAACITNNPNLLNDAAKVDEPFNADNGMYKSFSILKQLYDAKAFEADPLSSDWEPIKKDFQNGKVGMMYLGNWFVPQGVGDAVKLEDIGVFPFPYDNVKGPHNVMAGSDYGWGMGVGSKNPDAQLAFFKFLTDTMYADWAKQTGMLSARSDIAVDNPAAKEFESYKPVKLFSVANTKELDDCISKAQVDWDAMCQQVLQGTSLDTLFTDLNSRWKAARGN